MFHLVRGSAYLFLLVHRSCDHIYIHCAYLDIYIMMYVFFTYLYMCCFFFFFFIFMHMFLITCMQSIISISHKDALMSFV